MTRMAGRKDMGKLVLAKGPWRFRVLARAHPEDEDRRARAAAAWGHAAPPPRGESAASVSLPLETRIRTARYYDLPENERTIVDGASVSDGGRITNDEPIVIASLLED